MTDTKSLIVRIKEGATNEIESIYRAHRNEFISWAIRTYSCPVEDAKDAFQQAIVILYENIVNDKLTTLTSHIKTYLFAIGRNKLLESLKRTNKNIELPDVSLSENPDELLNAHMEKEGQLQRVELALENLGDPCRTILINYYYNKNSIKEIAEKLEYKNSDTVKSLKYKCIKRLKKIFGSDFEGLNRELA